MSVMDASEVPRRRHRTPATRRVHRIKLSIQLGEHFLDNDPDPADRMIRRDQIFGAQRAQH